MRWKAWPILRGIYWARIERRGNFAPFHSTLIDLEHFLDDRRLGSRANASYLLTAYKLGAWDAMQRHLTEPSSMALQEDVLLWQAVLAAREGDGGQAAGLLLAAYKQDPTITVRGSVLPEIRPFLPSTGPRFEDPAFS